MTTEEFGEQQRRESWERQLGCEDTTVWSLWKCRFMSADPTSGSSAGTTLSTAGREKCGPTYVDNEFLSLECHKEIRALWGALFVSKNYGRKVTFPPALLSFPKWPLCTKAQLHSHPKPKPAGSGGTEPGEKDPRTTQSTGPAEPCPPPLPSSVNKSIKK